jgi:hypothetical protein
MPMLLTAPSSSIIIPPVCGRRRSLCVVLNVHTHARQRLVPNRARHQSLLHPLHDLPEFLYEWLAECTHHLCLARRLGARCNLPATIGDRRGYLRGLQRGQIGEERCFFFFFEFWRREGERRTLRRRPVLSASMVKNSSVEENVGRS